MNKENIYERLHTQGFNPSTIVDIGSDVGSWSSMVRSIFKTPYILAIDAKIPPAGVIHSANKSVFEVLSNVDGEIIDFYKTTTGSGTGDSIFRENSQHYQDHNTAVEQRISKTLKTILNENSIEVPQLLKIDTQGSELVIMQGLGDLLYDVEFIELECSLDNYNKGGALFDDVYMYLRDNFRVYDITGFFRSFSSDLVQVDVIFQNKKSNIQKLF